MTVNSEALMPFRYSQESARRTAAVGQGSRQGKEIRISSEEERPNYYIPRTFQENQLEIMKECLALAISGTQKTCFPSPQLTKK